jgi:uncharacterized protein (DUF1800 family)
MTNRSLFALVFVPALLSAQATQTTLLPEQQAQHVLNRLAFGPRPGEIAKVRSMGIEKWIDQQLHPEKIDDREATSLLRRYRSLETPTVEIEQAYREAQQRRRQEQRMAAMQDSMSGRAPNNGQQPPPNPAAGRELQNRVVQELLSSKVARAANSERQLYEMMVDFWENHFSVYVQKGQTRIYLLDYDRDVIRPRAMGKFRDLLGAVAHSPAMLFYLDNAQSRADSAHPTLEDPRRRAGRGRGAGAPGGVVGLNPQQIARFCDAPNRGNNVPQRLQQAPPQVRDQVINGSPAECIEGLMQLAQRAQAPARGLNENYARELMELHTLGVDGGYTQQDVIEVARALTGWTIDQQRGAFRFDPVWHDAAPKTVLGTTLPGGRGLEDGERVLDLVARHPSTAKHIATKLARRFISDDPPPSVVDRCAKVFTKTDGDIRETLSCVVKSPEFLSPKAYRAKVKTPFEVVVSGIRATQSQVDLRPGAPQAVAFLGQPIFGRQTPDGWPDVGSEWMNAGAILNRINFGLALAGDRVPGVVTGVVSELEATRDQPRERQVDAVVRVFFGGQVSPETREMLLSGENPFATRAGSDTAASTPMAPAMGPPGPGRNQPRVDMSAVRLSGLDQIIGLALGAPEFQRR